MNPPGHRSLPRRLLTAALLILVVLTAGAALTVWLMRERIVAMVFDKAEARLAEEGIHIRRGSYEWSWRRGVVLKQLDLFTDQEKQHRLARLDNVGIRIPLSEFSQASPNLYLSAEDSGLTLDSSAGALRLDQVNFAMTSSRSSLSIDHLDGRLRNLHITAGGLLRWQPDGMGKPLELPDLSPLVKASSWLDFPKGSPTLALEINTRDGTAGGINLTGRLTGSRFSWRNLSFARADVKAALADGAVEIPSLDVDCYGGNLKAALIVDPAAGLLKVGKLTSSVEPFRFVEAVMGRASLKSCRSLGKTQLSGSGLVFNTADFSRSSGVLKIDSPAGLAVDIGRMEVELKDFHGTLKFANGKLVVDGEEFAIHGGTGGGTYTTPLRGSYTYQLKVRGEGMSMEGIGREFGVKGPIAGRMNATFDGGGAAGMKSQFGSGRISVEDGNFYSIPLFGSLLALLTQHSPKFGVDEARDLNCNYALKDEILRSQDLRIESAATKLLAKGQVNLVQQTLDADVRANLRGVPGIATAVLSLIFEVHGEGPLDDVQWKLANNPGIVRGAAGVAIGGVKAVVGGTGKVIEGVGDTTWKLFEKRPGLFIPKQQTEPRK